MNSKILALALLMVGLFLLLDVILTVDTVIVVALGVGSISLGGMLLFRRGDKTK